MINKYTNLALASPSHTIPGLNGPDGNPIVFNGAPQEVKETMSKLFSYQKEYVNRDGDIEITWVPLSIFTMMLPKSDVFFNTRTNRNEKTMLYVPKGRFAEKSDKTGTYMNEFYDHHDLNAEQPKIYYVDSNGKNRYDNYDAYSKMVNETEVKRLYEILIEEMQEA
jgi:hypothetical protein